MVVRQPYPGPVSTLLTCIDFKPDEELKLVIACWVASAQRSAIKIVIGL
jgi:hypothetical protein